MRRTLLAGLTLALLAACRSSGAPPADAMAELARIVQSNSVALARIDPGGDDFADLQAFGDAVGERRFVILDEPSHGDGPVFRLKARLVEYLHRHKGFDVLLIESGLFDVQRMRERAMAEGRPLAALAPGRLFYMYSKTADGRRVIDYVDRTQGSARPLQLMGFDVPMGGDASDKELLTLLAAFLAGRGSSLPGSAEWAAYRAVAAPAIRLAATPPPSPAALEAFRGVSDRLVGELCGATPDDHDFRRSPGFWCRIVHSVRGGVERQWGPHDLRDRAGGDNVKWLVDHHFAGRKVVLWMHSFHALRGQRLPPSGPAWVNVGSRLVEHYGEQVYIAHFTSGRGTYDTYLGAGSTLAPLHAGRLEHHLLQAGGAARFMRLPPDAPSRERLARLSIFEGGYEPTLPNRFGSGYDGLFFIADAQPILPDERAYPVIP